MGTAIVASTNVRTMGLRSFTHGPTVRFNAVRVGKTAIQIIKASWCLLGGPIGLRVLVADGSWLDMVLLLWVDGAVGVLVCPSSMRDEVEERRRVVTLSQWWWRFSS